MDQEESDAQIVEAVLSGDRDAYAVLIQRHQRRIWSFVRGMCISGYDAEELTQAVFVRVYFALPTYKSEYSFSGWLHRIAYNATINFLRKERRCVLFDDDESEDRLPPLETLADPGASVEATVEARETTDSVWQAARDLPCGFRDVFVLRHLGQLSYMEIADVTGIPLGTVKSRLARARAMLLRAVSASA